MQKQATQLLGLLAAILIIWFVIPLISINHVELLPGTVERLSTISLVLLAWIGFLVYQLSKPINPEDTFNIKTSKLYSLLMQYIEKIKQYKKDPMSSLTEGPYTEANLILFKHFQLVREYFRKNSEKKKHPVYIVLGNKYSGKTTLLKKSGLTLKTIPIIPDKESKDPYQQHENSDEIHEDFANCVWNLHENCIFIDTPGDYANSEVGDTLQTPWRSLINLLLRKYQKFPLKGLVITISVHELLTNSQQNTRIHLHLLKQRLLDVKKYYGEVIPLHLVFTKWDCIPGFSEFFDDLSLPQRQKCFAIEFDKDFSEQAIVSQFQQQYEVILQQLSRLLITRMHQEHNHKKRALISQFPLQMEQLQKVFHTIIKQLMEKAYDSDIATPASIYFTSGQQGNETVDPLFKQFQSSFDLPEKSLVIATQILSKDYFIQTIFHKLSSCEKPARSELVVSRKNQYMIYGATSLIVLSFASFALMKFTDGLKTINTAEANSYALTLLKNSSPNSTATKNATLALANQVDQASHFWLGKKILASDSPAITHGSLALSAPITAVGSLPNNLQNYIESKLSNSSASPDALYSTLKVYLMLGNPEHLQYAWLTHWLTNNAVKNQIIASNNVQQMLLALQNKQALFTPKSALIEQARKELTTLPKQYLAYIMLQSEANYADSSGLLINIANKRITVPLLFTAKGLQTVFLNDINPAINQALNGNWVLGTLPQDKTSSANIQQQIIGMYTSNYVSWWSKVFFEIKIPTVTNFQSLANYVALLSDPNQGIIHAYQLALDNTNANSILPTTINKPLIADIRNSLAAQVNVDLSDLTHLDLNSVQSALTQYSQFLNNLMVTNNVPQTAFLIVKNQIQNPTQSNILMGFGNFANTLPEPLSSSFTNLAKQSIQLTEQAAADYLQTAWETQVVQFYNDNIANRYPIYTSSEQDIDLDAFTQFFGPNGILEQFYENNLAMFVDTSSSVWQWQSLEGVNLPLSNQLLLALEKARIISAMFFPQNSSSLQVDFSLQQIALMPIVQSFSLNMNGQALDDPQGTRNISSFVWPGNSGALGTQISFLDVNGQRAVNQAEGPWSWFRMLNASGIHSKGNSQNYVITFDVDGNEARYLLSAENSINPFIPGIVNTFRLPEQIVT